MSERNYVGEITLEYFPEISEISLYIDEVGATFLTMDQVDSLASILRGWVEKYHQAEQVRQYNREIDERNAINMVNREKPWLPIHDGE